MRRKLKGFAPKTTSLGLTRIKHKSTRTAKIGKSKR